MLATLFNFSTMLLGDSTSSWITTVGTWALGLVALAVGFFLLIRALLDLRSALGGDNKEWGKAVVGLFIGLIGGLIGWWGASSIISWFRNNGNTIPHS